MPKASISRLSPAAGGHNPPKPRGTVMLYTARVRSYVATASGPSTMRHVSSVSAVLSHVPVTRTASKIGA